MLQPRQPLRRRSGRALCGEQDGTGSVRQQAAQVDIAAVADPPSPYTRKAPILRSLRGTLKAADPKQYRKHLDAKYR